jgi:hypothetical protein
VGRFEESVAETVLFVLVPVPGVFEVGIDEFAEPGFSLVPLSP